MSDQRGLERSKPINTARGTPRRRRTCGRPGYAPKCAQAGHTLMRRDIARCFGPWVLRDPWRSARPRTFRGTRKTSRLRRSPRRKNRGDELRLPFIPPLKGEGPARKRRGWGQSFDRIKTPPGSLSLATLPEDGEGQATASHIANPLEMHWIEPANRVIVRAPGNFIMTQISRGPRSQTASRQSCPKQGSVAQPRLCGWSAS